MLAAADAEVARVSTPRLCRAKVFSSSDADAREIAERELYLAYRVGTTFADVEPPLADGQQALSAALLQAIADVECVPKHQAVLRASSDANAQMFAASALVSLVNNSWARLTYDQRFELRSFALDLLSERSESDSRALATFVREQLISLLCRITKLSWCDDYRHHHTVNDATRFLLVSCYAADSVIVLGLALTHPHSGEPGSKVHWLADLLATDR